MKIIFNNTLHIFSHEEVNLLPGTNVVEKFNEKHPIVEAMIEDGELEIYEGKAVTSEVKTRAVAKATTAATLNALEKEFSVTKESTEKRRKTIADYSKEVDEALKKETESKES